MTLFVFSSVLAAWLFTTSASAACNTDANHVYEKFKEYRKSLDKTRRVEQLSPFFTQGFKQYYQIKINKTRGSSKKRFLNQYWDNLNTGRDIIIVYNYLVRCTQNQALLVLDAVLDKNSTGSLDASKVDLWNVTIEYQWEQEQWLIQDFAYKKSPQPHKLDSTKIKDNFFRLR